MLPCADCAYEARCMKWAVHYCPDYKLNGLPPPLVPLTTWRAVEDRSVSTSRNISPITLLHIDQRPVRLRA